MRKTLFLVEEYPPYKGGVGRFMHQLSSFLPPDNKIILAAKHSAIQYPDSLQTIQITTRYVWPHWLPAVFRLIKIAKKEKVEQIVVSSVLPYGILAFATKIITKIPYTVVVHGMDILHIRKNMWKRKLAKKILLEADSVIANSSFTRQQLQLYNLQDAKSVVVNPAPYCTPQAFTQKISEEIETFIREKKLILSVGRLVSRKNFETVISLSKEYKENKDVVFLISGDGPLKTELELLITKYKLENKIRIIQSNDEELAGLYAKSRCVLFIPTSDNGDVEGFGIVGAEAAAFGVPCVASNQGGVPDAVKNNETGVLVDPLDIDEIKYAVDQLLEDQSYWDSLHKKALRYSELKRRDNNARQTMELLLGNLGEEDISVVIPAYNAEATILSCISSIKRQTVRPKEIIVVDDGSTDSTSELVTKYNKGGVRLLKQQNAGAPKARNNGAGVATGRFIIFLDSDIIATPRMLECMKRTLLLHPEASYCYSRFYFGCKKFPSFSFSETLLKKHNYIHTSSLIRKRDLVAFDESLRRHQDWDLWLSMLKNDKKGILYPEYLYKIQLQENRISSWLPSFIYKFPLAKRFKRVSAYEKTSMVIRKKHDL